MQFALRDIGDNRPATFTLYEHFNKEISFTRDGARIHVVLLVPGKEPQDLKCLPGQCTTPPLTNSRFAAIVLDVENGTRVPHLFWMQNSVAVLRRLPLTVDRQPFQVAIDRNFLYVAAISARALSVLEANVTLGNDGFARDLVCVPVDKTPIEDPRFGVMPNTTHVTAVVASPSVLVFLDRGMLRTRLGEVGLASRILSVDDHVVFFVANNEIFKLGDKGVVRVERDGEPFKVFNLVEMRGPLAKFDNGLFNLRVGGKAGEDNWNNRAPQKTFVVAPDDCNAFSYLPSFFSREEADNKVWAEIANDGVPRTFGTDAKPEYALVPYQVSYTDTASLPIAPSRKKLAAKPARVAAPSANDPKSAKQSFDLALGASNAVIDAPPVADDEPPVADEPKHVRFDKPAENVRARMAARPAKAQPPPPPPAAVNTAALAKQSAFKSESAAAMARMQPFETALANDVGAARLYLGIGMDGKPYASQEIFIADAARITTIASQAGDVALFKALMDNPAWERWGYREEVLYLRAHLEFEFELALSAAAYTEHYVRGSRRADAYRFYGLFIESMPETPTPADALVEGQPNPYAAPRAVDWASDDMADARHALVALDYNTKGMKIVNAFRTPTNGMATMANAYHVGQQARMWVEGTIYEAFLD